MITKQVVALGWMLAGMGWAQAPVPPQPALPPRPVVPAPPGELPDAPRAQRELGDLFRRYPPNLRGVLQLDPSLLNNPAYLAPYPALAAYLSQHPEVARNPSFYLGNPEAAEPPQESVELAHSWENMLGETEGAAAGMLAMCLIAWLIRSFLENRRWRNATKAQAEAHAKLLDRLSNNEDLMAYINSPAGSRFLQSAPVALDATPRAQAGSPVARILWTVQGGVVLLAVGIGLEVVSRQSNYPVQQPLHALGILAAALGIGFVVSAIVSFLISQRLGLIEHRSAPTEHA